MNSLGKLFRISILGESHGERIGVVIDGCPSGLPITMEDFDDDLNRRRSRIRICSLKSPEQRK